MSSLSKTIRNTVSAVVAAAIAGALVVSVAGAQSPPNPPSRFVGSVTVNGAQPPAGTLIEARIGTATCGVATVFYAGGQARYTLDSPALEPSSSPGCGIDGSSVAFYVGGQKANETGSWANYRLNTVDLTITAPVTPVATAVPTTTPGRTPAPPVAGNGPASGSSLPLVEFMLLAAALGLAGVGAAARVRNS